MCYLLYICLCGCRLSYDQMLALIHASLPESSGLARQVFKKVEASVKMLKKTLPKVDAAPSSGAKKSMKTKKRSKADQARIAAVTTRWMRAPAR